MKSEDVKLKEDTKEKDHENNNKIIEVKNNKESQAVNVKKRKAIIPLINYKQHSIFAASILNYFAIGAGLCVFSFVNLECFSLHKHSIFFRYYYFLCGIVLYIIGIFDWFLGKELLFIIDFIFSFQFLSLFFLENNFKGNIIITTGNNRLHGTFYLIFCTFLIFITVSSKNKGVAYIVDYAVLSVGYLILFLCKYIEKGEKVYSIILIIAGALFWITGILKLIDNTLIDKSIPFLKPSD